MFTFATYVFAVLVGFGVGLLVGRRNPAVADAAAAGANAAVQQAKKL